MLAKRSRLVALLSVLLMVFLSAGSSMAAAEAANQTLKQANALFQQQKFAEASELYQGLLDQGHRTATVLYNLGTAEARAGDFPGAYAHLLAAQRMAPRNDSIKVNLEQVEQNLFPDERKRPVQGFWRRASMLLTASEWSALLFTGLLVTSISFAAGTIVRRQEVATLLRGTAGFVFVITLLIGPLAATSIYSNWVVKEAVAVRTAEVRSGPNERFAVIEALPAAAKVRVLDDSDNGYRNIETVSGRVGYVPATALAPI